MRCHLTAALCVLVTCGLAVSYGQETHLSYRTGPGIDREIGRTRGGFSWLSQRWPADPMGLPEVVAEKPCFGTAIDGRQAVMDSSEWGAAALDVLWLDADDDGQLAEDEKFALTGNGGGSAIIPVEMPTVDGTTVQHFQVMFEMRGGRPALSWRSAGYYTGEVLIGERTYRVALVDVNANGRFDDANALYKDGDRLLIDDNEDGRFGTVRYVGPLLRVAGAYWGLEVATDGSHIVLSEPQVETGTLHVDEDSLTVTVAGEAGRFVLTRTTAEEPFVLPVGSYAVERVEVHRTDDAGVEWSIRSQRGEGPAFRIEPGRETAVRVAEPLAVHATIDWLSSELGLLLSVRGEGDLPYLIFRGGRMLEDTFGVLVKADGGAWQQHYDLRQGGRLVRPLSLTEVERLGPLTAVAEADAGPFELTTPALAIPTGPPKVELPYRRAPIRVDGDLSEWDDVPHLPYTSRILRAPPYRLCWREEGIYGALVTRDRSIEPDLERPWQGDAMQIMLEKDFARSETTSRNAFQIDLWPLPANGPGPAGSRLSWPEPDGSWGLLSGEDIGLECAWAPTEGGYVMEFLIPASELLPAVMEEGTMVGMELFLRDYRGKTTHMVTDVGYDNDWARPATWTPVRLAGPAGD